MIECKNVFEKRNLKIIGFWEGYLSPFCASKGGIVVQDKDGNKKCLSWAEIKKMSDNDNISEKGMLKKSEKFNTSEEYVKSDNLIDEITAAEITQEATEADIGKLCKFWDNGRESFGLLTRIADGISDNYYMSYAGCWNHCRRLTKQEIEELC